MVLEYFDDVVKELSKDYGMRRKHIFEYLEKFLTIFPVNGDDVDSIAECLERIVSERSSISKYSNPHKAYSLKATMERAYESVYGERSNEITDSLKSTILEDEFFETLRLDKCTSLIQL